MNQPTSTPYGQVLPGESGNAAIRDAEASRSGEQWKQEIGRFIVIALQLGLLALIIRQFQLINLAFLRVALLCFAGFAVHHFLPMRLKMPFFVALSLIGIGVIFGPANGAWLVAIGLVLAGICHLPLPLAGRVGLVIAAGALLAMMRADWFASPLPHAVWPILGSMFMFRLIVYLYDIRHDKRPASVWATLSYFFMLPNVCFPLFPVIDYKTFRGTYYDRDPYRIYQVGIDWMLRGIVHLILYRFIYYELTLAPAEVVTPSDLAQFLLTTFLLYLKVSGQFHFVIGMLHLFGFNLPETNRLYLLTSSFNDFWRRINIYWKDFMMKVFYYPAFFRLRGLGTTQGLILATFFVFVVTWMLHSYQWFWLRGTFPVGWQDGIFWMTLAVLVTVNSLYEMKFGRKRSLTQRNWGVGSAVGLALRTLATVTVVCVLWSLWTADSFSQWLALWASLTNWTAEEYKLLVIVLAVVAVIAGTKLLPMTKLRERGTGLPGMRFAPTAISLVLLAAIAMPQVYTSISTTVANNVLSLRSDRLNRIDKAALRRNYYQDLINVDRFNNQLWEVYMKKPANWLDVKGSGLTRLTNDYLQEEMIPNIVTRSSYASASTNRWGMRDQDYELTPPPNTHRIAMLGASRTMGWGVADNETFESLFEVHLNREFAGQPYERHEVLNFGVPGYVALHQLKVLERVYPFSPDAVFIIAAGREMSLSARYLAKLVRKKVDIPYPFLRELAARAGVDAETSETAAVRKLAPFHEELMTWLYGQIVRECRQRGITPVWVYMPLTYHGSWEKETAPSIALARKAGFVVINLARVFDGQKFEAIILNEWDDHPNALGHRLMADQLFDAVRKLRRDIFGARSAKGSAALN